MKIESYTFPKSSFLSLEKDYSLIIDKIIKNQRLKKLLYYDTMDALDKEDLNQKQTLEVLSKHIKIVPKLTLDKSLLTYLVISFDNFSPTTNPSFRDNTISIDIICQFDVWSLGDYKLRPFKIAGELDSMLNNSKLTGIGKLQFMTANFTVLNEDYGVLSLLYEATHGEEDKKGMLNPADEAEFIKDFNEIYNS